MSAALRFAAALILSALLYPATAGAVWHAVLSNGQTSPDFSNATEACELSYKLTYGAPYPPFGDGTFQKMEPPRYNIFGQMSPIMTCDYFVPHFGGVIYNGAAIADCPAGYSVSLSAPGGCVPPPRDDPGPSCGANKAPGNHVGNPIDIISGNKSESATDFSTPGAYPIGFTRYYDSQWTAVSRLGAGWRSGYDRYFNSTAGVVRMVLGDGRFALFSQSGSNWVPAYFDTSGNILTPRTDVSWSLAQTSSGWVFTDEDGTVENYSSSGVLGSIVYRGGYTQTLAYDANGNNTSVSDSFGRQILFGYSDNGLLTTVTAPDGQVYQYQYLERSTTASTTSPSWTAVLSGVTYPAVPPGASATLGYLYEDSNTLTALTGIVDERGVRFASWTYDANGNAISSEHANGVGHVGISYDFNGNTRTVTNAAGKQAVYQLGTRKGSLLHITSVQGQPSANCAGSVKQLGYDSNGYLNQRIDAEGRTTTWTNDAQGHPLSRTDGAGTALARTTTMSWWGAYSVPTQIVQPGLTVNLSYDLAGRLTQRQEVDTTSQTLPYSTNGQTRTWTYSYNTAGLLASIDGPLAGSADLTSFGYDANGYLNSVTNALGQVTQVTSVNGLGQPLSIVDPNGVTTSLVYDARGRLTQYTVNPGSNQAQTQIGYDAAGDVSTLVRPNGASYTLSYDDARRLSAIQNGAGERIEYTRNAMGGVTAIRVRNSSGIIVRFASATFDELNRLLTQVGAGSQTTAYAYDRTDNTTGTTDPLGRQYAYGYDALNRLVSESGPLQYTVSYGYDAQDHQTSVTDPLGHVTSYVYDGFGDVIRRVSPDTGTTDYSYDARGLVLTETSARGVVTSYGYDLLGRVTSRGYSTNPSENVTYTYDDGSNGNKGIGRLTLMSDASGSTAYTYNALGQVTQEQRSIAGSAYLTRYTYDASGQVNGITYPSGRIVSYSRDGEGRVTGVAMQDSAGAAAVTLVSGGSYLPYGPLSGFTYGNGLVYGTAYDSDYRLTNLVTGQGAAAVQSLQYGYDAASNITSIADNLDSSRSQVLGYDALNRLTSASGGYGSYAYSYDAAGNRSSRTVGAGAPETYSYDSASSRLLSIGGGASRGFSYAASGQVTGDSRGAGQVYGYTLNAAGMVGSASVNGASLLSNLYDGDQHRVQKQVPGASGYTAQYLYDRQGHLLGEAGPGGATRDLIWLGDQPIAQVDYNPLGFTQLAYLHADQVNRVQKASNPNQSLAWDGVAGPFGESGNATGSLTMNLGFPGQYLDRETGLWQNWHRDYDAGTGRYLESDPIGLVGGINTYAYADGNPISNVDPLGLATYQCTRKLNHVPIRVGPLYHQYICTGDAQSGYSCGGLGPTGNMFDSPGKIESDQYSPGRCEKVDDDNQCVEQCVAKQFSSPVPNYSVDLSHGQNCQTYANSTQSICEASCKVKHK